MQGILKADHCMTQKLLTRRPSSTIQTQMIKTPIIKTPNNNSSPRGETPIKNQCSLYLANAQ
jgi:hypothetical protein